MVRIYPLNHCNNIHFFSTPITNTQITPNTFPFPSPLPQPPSPPPPSNYTHTTLYLSHSPGIYNLLHGTSEGIPSLAFPLVEILPHPAKLHDDGAVGDGVPDPGRLGSHGALARPTHWMVDDAPVQGLGSVSVQEEGWFTSY